MLFRSRGIAVASGTSCVSKSLKVSHVLSAIGLDHALGQAAILLTPGKDTTDVEIDYVLETLPQVVSKLRGMSPAWDEFQLGAVDSLIAPRQLARPAARAKS